ncbi:MAG: hypothetical protein MK212_21885 [Saprospiraceae bacterium]|nr:hypothetical protein [Saprospiraceae bacterium]
MDDPTRNDNEFLPSGKKEWDYWKYMNKSNRVAQTIRAIGKEHIPDIIGLAEIENRIVLEDLLLRPAFHKKNYAIIHQNSPDPRGIDVALLYNAAKYTSDTSIFIPIVSKNPGLRSRDILYTCLVNNKDTLHIFVNHWSSRLGGIKKSESKRLYASQQLSTFIDSLNHNLTNPKIIVTGDFNDDPENTSLTKLTEENELINLALEIEQCGTTYYKKGWFCFDQILISKSINDGFKVSYEVMNLPFLGSENKEGDFVPNRTYKGSYYNNGFSDHYPVYLKLY